MLNQQPNTLRAQPSPVVIGLIIRNSTARQVGNYRSVSQSELADRLQARGYRVQAYDEQGTSGADLAKRKVATQMLEDLKRGTIQGIAAYDVKRLTRDEFGVDGGTIARRIVEAGGRFITWDKEYDLRNDDDLLQFQFQCFIAGIDWRNIRNTLWSGIFKRVEREPMFLKPPLGYMTELVPGDRPGRVLKRPTKNPDHAPIMAALERALDESRSIPEVVARLTSSGIPRPAFRGRGGTTTVWSSQAIHYLLNNPIYTGTYVFGRFVEARGRSTVWNKFALDPNGGYREYVHHVPELAYWDAARVRRWLRKFHIRQGEVRPRIRRFMHPLVGVLRCNRCGEPMIGSGQGTYVCRANATGACLQPQWMTDSIAMCLLRTVLPDVMFSAQELAEEALRQARQHAPSEAEQRLAYLEEKSKRMADDYFDVPSEALKAKLQDAQLEINALRDQVAQEQDERLADEQMARGLQSLLGEPLALFDALPTDKQARIYQILFNRVRIECLGRGTGRRWRLVEYVSTFEKGRVAVSDSATVRLPNPSELRFGKFQSGAPIVSMPPSQTPRSSRLESSSKQSPTRSQVTATSGLR